MKLSKRVRDACDLYKITYEHEGLDQWEFTAPVGSVFANESTRRILNIDGMSDKEITEALHLFKDPIDFEEYDATTMQLVEIFREVLEQHPEVNTYNPMDLLRLPGVHARVTPLDASLLQATQALGIALAERERK